MIPEGPLLWYVNRSTGLVLLVLLTLTVLLGVWSTRGDAGTRLPRFVVQSVHRNIGLLSMVALFLHIVSAVLDEFVDIRWWQSFVPWSLRYEPMWLAFGIVAFDLLLAVSLSSLVRDRLDRRGWWLLHLTTYACWVASMVHGLGIGTDSQTGWARWTYAACGVLVLVAVALRLAGRRPAPHGAQHPLPTVGALR